jgi:hypothetical protein
MKISNMLEVIECQLDAYSAKDYAHITLRTTL